MQRRKKIIAIYAGSFDPVTHGHIDIIRRAASLFNELVVGVGTNPDKQPLFTPAERLALLAPHIRQLSNVHAEAYEGLTIDFARRKGATTLLRGIRDVADFSDEWQQANLNLQIGEMETVFLTARDQYVLTSSTYIKQIFEMGGGDLHRIKRLVPPNVADQLAHKLRARAGNGKTLMNNSKSRKGRA